MDPRIRIHTKMSWIRNTAGNSYNLRGIVPRYTGPGPVIIFYMYSDLIFDTLNRKTKGFYDFFLFFLFLVGELLGINVILFCWKQINIYISLEKIEGLKSRQLFDDVGKDPVSHI